MRISTRLRIITGATIVALVILIPVLIWVFVEFKTAKDDDALADALHDNYFERASYRDQYFLHREDRLRDQWVKSKHDTDGLVAQAEVQFHRLPDKQLLERFRRSLEDTAQLFDRIVVNTQVMKTAVANKGVYEEFDKRLYNQLLLIATDVRMALTTLQSSTERRVQQNYKLLAIITSLFALTLSLAVILTALQMDRMIRRRLLPLHRGVNVVAEGNLDYRIETEGSDEFAELANSINDMSGTLRATTQRLGEEIAQRVKAETMRELDARFKTWFELPLVGIAITSPAKGWIEINDHLCRMLAYSKEELFHLTWADLTHPDDLAADVAKFESVLRGEIDSYALDKRFLRKDGSVIPVALSVRCVRKADGTVDYFIALLQNITERRQAEAALRDEKERIETILDTVADPIFVKDNDHCIVLANPAFYEMFALDKGAAIGKTLVETVPVDERIHFLEVDRRVLDTGVTDVREEALTIGDLARTIITRKSRLILHSGEKYLVGSIHDITEPKRLEAALIRSKQELQGLTRSVLEVREEDRRKIARELHDDLGHRLTTLSIDLERMESKLLPSESATKAKFPAIIDHVYQTVDAIRRIGEDLRPGMLDALGLPAAVESHVKTFAARTGIPCELVMSHDDFAVDGNVAINIFRIVQETLNNSMKYSKASNILVTLQFSEHEISLIVEDNGIGMAERDKGGRIGFGLLGMRERVSSLNGHLMIASEPGRGVRIEAVIPT